jgi:hypothetical protein
LKEEQMGRRDGYEGQLPEMPWKGGIKHDWEQGGMDFGGGHSYEWTCKKCGMEYCFVFWEVDTDEEWDKQNKDFDKFFANIPKWGCSGKQGLLLDGTPIYGPIGG